MYHNLMNPLLFGFIHSPFISVHLTHYFLGKILKEYCWPKGKSYVSDIQELPNCLSGKLDEFRLPLAVYQNVHFFQHMLSLNFVSHFNICQ